MTFNSKKVEKIVRSRGIKAKDFFAFVYPDRSGGNLGLTEIGKNDNPKANAIERIADLLHCTIDDLFEREHNYSINQVNGDNNTLGDVHINTDPDPEVLMITNKHLRDIIERQDKIIAEQNRRIDQLIELAKQ